MTIGRFGVLEAFPTSILRLGKAKHVGCEYCRCVKETSQAQGITLIAIAISCAGEKVMRQPLWQDT